MKKNTKKGWSLSCSLPLGRVRVGFCEEIKNNSCQYFFTISIFCFLFSCATRTGEPTANVPPETKLFLSAINLSDTNSFSGRIRLYWTGETPSGYIKMYEIASDTGVCNGLERIWSPTTRTDSAFLFKVPQNAKYAKISFYVRAIDNEQRIDPTPACLEVPVKNAPPEIKFDRVYGTKSLTDTVHQVFSLSWTAEDEDGTENLDSVFVSTDSLTWVGLSKNVNFITLVPISPESTTETDAKILTGFAGTDNGLLLKGLKMNTQNKIYIKNKDISNEFSNTDTTNLFYLKAKKGDVLIIDSYNVTGFFAVNERLVYDPILRQTFPNGYEIYNINRSNSEYLPRNWNLTFLEYMKLYKSVFWFSDTRRYEGSLAIELAATAIQNYLNSGGRLLISQSSLPSDANSPIYTFSTADSLYTKQGNAVLNTSASTILGLVANSLQGLPSLALNVSAIGNLTPTPFYHKLLAQPLYEGSFLGTNEMNGSKKWLGPSTVAAFTKGSNTKANMIFFAFPLHLCNGKADDLTLFFNQIFNKEFAD